MPKFVARQRKHRVLAREKAGRDAPRDETSGRDANATEILPAEKKEMEQRKRAIKEELVRESAGKMSAKKKKRLDKYIVRMGWLILFVLLCFLYCLTMADCGLRL